MKRPETILLALLLLFLLPASAPAQSGGFHQLDAEVRALKLEVINLNRDLLVLEEELLFPGNTQLAVFLSADVGELFKLDSVQLKVNDKIVANHLYSEREVDALRRGGVQRLYLGNVKTGEHELTALFVGYGPQGREYRRGTSLRLTKGEDPKYVELRIEDSTRSQQPEFAVKDWE
jgi:hypothetical protein